MIINHRRIDVSGGWADDADFLATHTLPDFTPGTAKAEGGLEEIIPSTGKLLVWAVLYDGMADDDEPIATGTFEIDLQVISYHEPTGAFAARPAAVDVPGQVAELVENLPPTLPCFVRATNGQNLGAAAAVWIFVETEVR